jgi:hypothetical protein
METPLHRSPRTSEPIPLLQQPPFRYVDALQHLDVTARQAVLRLNLHAGQHRWSGTQALPGYLLIEAMAQAAGVLLRHLTEGEPGGFLVGIEQARLPAEVAYPAELELRVELSNATPPFFNLNVQVHRDDQALARAELQVMTRRNFA